jgi:hypothetical protein
VSSSRSHQPTRRRTRLTRRAGVTPPPVCAKTISPGMRSTTPRQSRPMPHRRLVTRLSPWRPEGSLRLWRRSLAGTQKEWVRRSSSHHAVARHPEATSVGRVNMTGSLTECGASPDLKKPLLQPLDHRHGVPPALIAQLPHVRLEQRLLPQSLVDGLRIEGGSSTTARW